VGADRGPNRSWITDNRPETLRRQARGPDRPARRGQRLTYLRLGGDGQAPPSDVPLEDSPGALIELRDQRLIRRIGLSGANPGQLRRARQVAPIAAVQNRYNLLDRSGVEALADCEAHGIAFVPYWPLAFGQLTQREELDAPARSLGATHAQVSLAWLLRRSPVLVPIPGTTSAGHLRSNVAAGAVAKQLTDEEITTLSSLIDEPPYSSPLRLSDAEPGSTPDITAARLHALPALHKTAAKGLPTLADKGYTGAGIGALIPHRRPKGQPEQALYPGTRSANALIRHARAQGEHTAAELKQRWHSLQHITLSPNRIGDITRAALVLNGIWK